MSKYWSICKLKSSPKLHQHYFKDLYDFIYHEGPWFTPAQNPSPYSLCQSNIWNTSHLSFSDYGSKFSKNSLPFSLPANDAHLWSLWVSPPNCVLPDLQAICICWATLFSQFSNEYPFSPVDTEEAQKKLFHLKESSQALWAITYANSSVIIRPHRQVGKGCVSLIYHFDFST